MGTYEKQYSIKWLNINPENKTIEAKYGVMAILDDNQKAKLDDIYASFGAGKFDELYQTPITVFENQTSLGEFINFLLSCAARAKDPLFPVDNELHDTFGDLADSLLNT